MAITAVPAIHRQCLGIMQCLSVPVTHVQSYSKSLKAFLTPKHHSLIAISLGVSTKSATVCKKGASILLISTRHTWQGTDFTPPEVQDHYFLAAPTCGAYTYIYLLLDIYLKPFDECWYMTLRLHSTDYVTGDAWFQGVQGSSDAWSLTHLHTS